VIEHKERGRLELAAPLGRLLAAAIVAPGRRPVTTVLVPVPSSPSATRHRGHDPVLRITRASRRSLPGRRVVVRPVLRHRRRTLDQSGLDVGERVANLDAAFVATQAVHQGPAPTDCDVVVTDDVCSSGATLAAAVAALVRVGVPASLIRGAVVAAPVLRSRRGPPTHTTDHW
jgi:predicted amidophosphoribosyltransferase